MRAAAKCPQCGHRFVVAEPAAAVPYNIDALTRIKNGATARELGWDGNFYTSVCRKHGLPPNVYPPKTQAPPEIAATPPIASEAQDDGHVPHGGFTYHVNTRELRSAHQMIRLGPQQGRAFALLTRGTIKLPTRGQAVREHLSLADDNSVGGYIDALRAKLKSIHISVDARRARHHGGYWSTSSATGSPIVVILIGETR